MGSTNDCVRLRRRKARFDLGNEVILIFLRGGKVTFHRAHECPRHEAHLSKKILALDGIDGHIVMRIGLFHEFCAIPLGLVAIPGCGHAIKVARMVDIQSPKLASFVPAIVGRIRSKD